MTTVRPPHLQVLYFAHTLRLLALCCLGKNASTQRQCRQWIPLKNVCPILAGLPFSHHDVAILS